MDIIKELEWRGLVKQITNEDKILKAQKNSKGVYCGFDPTADSLHVGHLIPIILLERFKKFGFKPIALIGGGTGMIGDPSFKSNERILQTDEQVLKNVKGIEKQLKKIIPNIKTENNAKWLNKMSLIDFLRDVGKNFTLSYLLAKESIATRIETGLSVTEFTYTMLQGYDFYKLYTEQNCYVQIGGSDQWGNITSGIDYIGSQVGRDKSEACGLTIQLLSKKDGKKFGKSESGAIWLDSLRTSEYEFYQFWLNQDDEDCEQMLKFVTFLTENEVKKLVEEHKKDSSKRIMQKKLASEITLFVHGKEGLDKALKVTEALFSGDFSKLSIALFVDVITNQIPVTMINKKTSVIDALIEAKVSSSKREAREFISSGSIKFNDINITNENDLLGDPKFTKIENNKKQYILIKRGKRKFFTIEIK